MSTAQNLNWALTQLLFGNEAQADHTGSALAQLAYLISAGRGSVSIPEIGVQLPPPEPVTIAVNTTLPRLAVYGDVTVNNGVVVRAASGGTVMLSMGRLLNNGHINADRLGGSGSVETPLNSSGADALDVGTASIRRAGGARAGTFNARHGGAGGDGFSGGGSGGGTNGSPRRRDGEAARSGMAKYILSIASQIINEDAMILAGGGGGGGSGVNFDGYGGGGGVGAGGIIIYTLDLDNRGIISADAGDGFDERVNPGEPIAAGGGGGGGAGLAGVLYSTLTNEGTIRAIPGMGGSGTNSAGGNGGAGLAGAFNIYGG